MKKLLTVLLTGLILTGCSSNSSNNDEKVASNKLEEILANGKIIVATSPDYAPLEFYNDSNEIIGSDIELANYIAEQLGVELELLDVDFTGTLTAVDTNKADLAISGFGWKADRADNYELSIAYNDVAESESGCNTLVIPADMVDTYNSFSDFEGKKIGGQANSIQEALIASQTNAESVPFATFGDGYLMLMSKKIDAIAVSCSVAKGQVSANEGIAVFSENFINEDITGNVVVAKKGESELIAKVNEYLEVVNSDGLYVQWDLDAKEQAEEMGISFE